jgi:hypothetical protein
MDPCSEPAEPMRPTICSLAVAILIGTAFVVTGVFGGRSKTRRTRRRMLGRSRCFMGLRPRATLIFLPRDGRLTFRPGMKESAPEPASTGPIRVCPPPFPGPLGGPSGPDARATKGGRAIRSNDQSARWQAPFDGTTSASLRRDPEARRTQEPVFPRPGPRNRAEGSEANIDGPREPARDAWPRVGAHQPQRGFSGY